MSTFLCALSPQDAGWLDGWLPAAAKAVGYERQTSEHLLGDSELTCMVIQRGLNPIGIVVVRHHHPRVGSAIIEFVGILPEYARLGLGMQAANEMEFGLRAAGVVDIYAPAVAAHGLSMYFWIRLGYAPIMQSDWPCTRSGVAWLRRSLT